MAKKAGAMPVFLMAMFLLLGLAAAQLLLPDRDFSDRENRPLAQMEKPGASGILSGRWMQAMETHVADQFPGRDAWMGLQALEDAALLRTERNGVLVGREGWLFEKAANLNLRTAQNNIEAVNRLAAEANTPVTLMLVPMSSAVYAEKLPWLYEADDQQILLDTLYAQSDAQVVDILPALAAQKDARQLFFRTDHHWTDAGAAVAHDILMEAWGLSPVEWPMDAMRMDAIYGSYFARAPSPLVLGDPFEMCQPQAIRLTVGDEAKEGLFDEALMETSRDKYAQLLYGNHGLITLESDAVGGTLLVIKDSYANMLLPKLSQHFSRIEAIDLRYFTGDLAAYLQETEAERILCLYGLTTFLGDRNLPLFAASFDD